MTVCRWKLIAFAPLFLWARAAIAQETSTNALDLEQMTEPVRVRARRPAVVDPTASVSDLGSERIDRARTSGEGLSDLAERAAGARVIDFGGPAHERRISIRGGSPAQSMLMLDGVALRTPFAIGGDLAIVGPESIARVALVRGGAGAALGDGALSGALIVDTISADDVAPLAVATSIGSQGTFGLRAAAAAHPAAIAVELERTSGDFLYLSRIAGLADEERRRANNDASRETFSLRVDRPAGEGTFDFLAAGALREGGVPGLETQASPSAREQRALGIARVAWRRPTRSDQSGVEVGLSASILDLDYRDPDPFEPAASSTRFLTAGFDGSIGLPLGAHLGRIGTELGVETSRSTEHGARTRARIALIAGDQGRFEDVTTFFALRVVKVGADSLQFLPRIGAVWLAGGPLALRFAGGRSLRAPSIDELYHPTENGFSGNPELLSETAWEGELALRLAGDSASVELVGFARSVDEAIVYLNRNAFTVRPENAGGARVFGAELEARVTQVWAPIEARLDLAGSALWSRLDEADAPLPGTPPFALDAELVLAPAAWPRWIGVFTRAHAAASSTANLSGTLSVEPYLRWDAGLTVEPLPGASASFTVQNLLDDRALESLNKVPLPGRAFLFTIRWEADHAS